MGRSFSLGHESADIEYHMTDKEYHGREGTVGAPGRWERALETTPALKVAQATRAGIPSPFAPQGRLELLRDEASNWSTVWSEHCETGYRKDRMTVSACSSAWRGGLLSSTGPAAIAAARHLAP